MPGPGYAFIDDAERDAVLRVIDHWRARRHEFDNPGSTGAIRALEDAAAERFGVPHCVPVNSGTSALLAGLAGLGVGPGDEVIVPGYMFVASIGAIIHSGATPVLAELDESLTIDPADVRAKITPNTRAIMPVHMLGAPCDMTALDHIAAEHGIPLLEDTAQATGGSHRGRPLGTLGAAGAFSLNPFKVVTGMDGGFLLTSDSRLFQRAHSFHDQGWFPHRRESGPGELIFGLNLRISELNAAVALVQLGKLDAVLAATRSVKSTLVELIGEHDGMRRRHLHDADGDCATVAVYLFDTAADAEAVAKRIGCKTLVNSPKHYYGGLPALAALGDGDPGPFPFRTRSTARRDYRRGALPRTDDILSRSVALATGVSDSYLGAGYGVSPFSTRGEIEQVAEVFRAAVAEVLG